MRRGGQRRKANAYGGMDTQPGAKGRSEGGLASDDKWEDFDQIPSSSEKLIKKRK